MLVTVQNVSGATIATLGVAEDGVAVGGTVEQGLPYPFSHVRDLADTASIQLPMHTADWRHVSVPWVGEEPLKEWNRLTQAGVVTVAVAAQTDAVDNEDLFVNAV